MRFVAGRATLQMRSWVRKSKRASFFRMAFDADRLVAKGHSHLSGLQSAMRLMAVDAEDSSFVKQVPIGLSKGRLGLFVAIETEHIACVGEQVWRFLWLMNTVAVCASNLILAMQAVRMARKRLCTDVAGETLAVRLLDGLTLKGKDLRSITGVHVGLTRSVTGFATLILPAFAAAGFQDLVGIPAESFG